MKKSTVGTILLLITAFIWGTSFVSQALGSQKLPPLFFNGTRMLIGSAVLLPLLIYQLKKTKYKISAKNDIIPGIIIAITLFCATNIQQVAFKYATASKIAFITDLYIVLVPLFSVFTTKKISLKTIIYSLIALLGIYFLSFHGVDIDKEGINRGEIYAFICSIFITLQIILVDKYIKNTSSILLAFIQFLFTGVVSLILSFFYETTNFENIRVSIYPLLYSGVFSSGIAYTLQVVGQRYTPTARASLIMCLESIFATLSSYLILGERLDLVEIFGCCLILLAVVLSSLGSVKDTSKKPSTKV